MNLVSEATRQRLAAHHPEAATEIGNLEAVLDGTSLDAGLLELCSRFFETSMRGDEWLPPESLTALETACLAVCEQFMVSVSGISDEQIAALNEHLNADDVYNLMSAIYLVEMSKRLDLTLEQVLQ
ncbi:MAG: hypothetical protein QNJ00_11360 [Woeseiaceae bacterium]|nr:hypothetical protein [Woeseiaceae bacterium]